jgi:hypothetical protein
VVEIVERNLDLLAGMPFMMPAPRVEFSEETIPVSATAEVESSPASNLPEYIQLNGRLDSPCDTDSPVYVRSSDGIVDEGSGTSFGLCLPEASAGGIQVIFRSGGSWLTAQV